MLILEPIGFVRNDVERSMDFSDVVSEIVIREDLIEGLYRIEESKEIEVIFWFDRCLPARMRVHPKGNPNNPLVGVFASRSPNRPNPIGVTRVQLIAIMGNILTVKGLDAFNGTPVLDIKPVERTVRDRQTVK
jgi:tRNA-Thr(GGU) m(6)t(6)A37 methyltransferase TsaA